MAGRDLVSEEAEGEGVGDDDQYHYAWPPPGGRFLHGVSVGTARSYPGEMSEAEARMFWAERQRKVPVPSMHGLTARVVTGLGRQLDTSALRGLAAGIVAPPEPGRWVQLSETAGDTAGVLAAWLATQAHRQWVAGGFEMADRVEVVASKEELVRMGLSSHGGSPVAVLEEALALLESTRLMGGADDKQPGSGRLVLDYFQAAKPRVSPKGGRPSAVYIVTVGWPLMPLRLEALAAERGFTVPRELAWYGPVLNPAWAPLTGNNRTHRTSHDRTSQIRSLGSRTVHDARRPSRRVSARGAHETARAAPRRMARVDGHDQRRRSVRDRRLHARSWLGRDPHFTDPGNEAGAARIGVLA